MIIFPFDYALKYLKYKNPFIDQVIVHGELDLMVANYLINSLLCTITAI